ncbi:hypothetical protein QTO34_009469 [Cnephaeus nilssonii]|uniref:P2X purinoceptor n=1 Tax=Cnephaeus nilssonii TaxID=3371016 RepID=A0AA40HIL3_CNENI|nr:hypothetical protein QTO34_009469 [Eptesicus nilssonii]
MARRLQDELAAFFFEYDTPRMVLVRNKKVGIIFRLIQLVVLVYVVGWVFVYEKGYQTSSGLISSVSVKLKGLAVTQLPGLGPQVWDVADYVFPAQGDSSFVVMTNFIVTPHQAQGYCAEHPEGGTCKDDSGCTPGKAERKAQGREPGGSPLPAPSCTQDFLPFSRHRTGKCVAFNNTVKTCEIFGWCPVEVDDSIPRRELHALHQEQHQLSTLRGQQVRGKAGSRQVAQEAAAAGLSCLSPLLLLLPLWAPGVGCGRGISGAHEGSAELRGTVGTSQLAHCRCQCPLPHRRNLVDEVNATYLKRCLYHKISHPLCPVFHLGYVARESGQSFSTLAEKGGVIGITIDWNCDLDWHVRHCKPVYEFHGLYEEKNLSQGFNFRFARYFVENGTNHRHLFKVFGIRFDILVDGKAGKFDIIPTMTTIGSGIGIFGVATVLCDLLLLHILPKRHYYKQKKFKYAEDMGPEARERDPAATSSTLGLQENMKTS